MYPDVERREAEGMARVAKPSAIPSAFSSSTSCASTPAKVCVCELVPLFDISQPTVSHHLKVLRDAGIVGSERQGLWAYYYVVPDALKELATWLT